MQASLASTARRARARSRRTGPITSHQAIELKGGNLFVQNVDVPTTVNPGDTFTVSWTVSNGANFIAGDDPDCCGPVCPGIPGTGSVLNGYQYRTFAEPSWTSGFESDQNCIQTTEIGTVDNPYSQVFTAPSTPGSVMIDIGIELTGSGNSAAASYQITVRDPQTEGCTADSECGPGEVCDNGECVPEQTNGGCTSDADCPGTQVCQNGSCVEPDPGNGNGGCTSDADCPGTQLCQNGTCVEPDLGCTSDADCAGDLVCENGECVSPSGNGNGGCASNAECPGDQVCVNGECLDPNGNGNGNGGCETNAECPGSQVCINGTCQQPPDEDGGIGSAATLLLLAAAGGVALIGAGGRSSGPGR